MIQHKRLRRLLKRGGYFIAALFVLVNMMAAFHAWKFTHYQPVGNSGIRDDTRLSFTQKLSALTMGISLPRAENTALPDRPFETVRLQSNKRIECWWMPVDSAVGTVILFHGYGGSKASLLDKADVFQNLRYNTLLADFMGAGGSEGTQTTIGFKEAAQVRTCVEHIARKGEQHIVLHGTSLGAAAIMKAMADGPMPVNRIILECPFGTMLRTVQNRFRMVGVPHFPLAYFLVFWGGLENGFNAFRHNPEHYAGSIKCPVLLIYGTKDPKVSPEETAAIFRNLAGPKKLLTISGAGHENYLERFRAPWTNTVSAFLKE